MTESNGNVVKDDDSNRLSRYATNIVLADSFAEKDKERKSLWVEWNVPWTSYKRNK